MPFIPKVREREKRERESERERERARARESIVLYLSSELFYVHRLISHSLHYFSRYTHAD